MSRQSTSRPYQQMMEFIVTATKERGITAQLRLRSDAGDDGRASNTHEKRLGAKKIYLMKKKK